ncbi:MAG: type II toxin-antitoxin system HicB family antitoxin [Bacteroidetes bacterium]|nr:type II toxin-antitoxin system HicB family antitoxin [Bacteroidota bacterium]
MKNINYYLKLNFNVDIKFMADGIFCAEIKEVPGLSAYGKTMKEALDELEKVKKVSFEMMISQNKEIPLPIIKLEIPVQKFEQLKNKRQLQSYVVT